jgi:uncharacterized membrane protein YphA (DoxX/SURF4 family)
VSVAWFSALLLVSVFAWAVIAKVVNPDRWRQALEGYGLPAPLKSVSAGVVPCAEAVVCGLLLAGRSMAAAILALVLMVVFSWATLRARRFVGSRLPCGCFGGTGVRDARLMLVRNIALAIGASVVLARGSDLSLFDPLNAPGGGDLLPAALVVIGAVLVASMLWTAAMLTRGER